MTEYHKIHSMFLRDTSTRQNRLMIPELAWARPEFEYLAGNEWVFTEKVDGTNMRLYYYGPKFEYDPLFQIKGRTESAQIPPKLFAACDTLMRERFTKLAEVFPDAGLNENPVVLYGEGYGAGIQKGGGKYRAEPGFVLFDVKVGPWTLSRANVVDVADKLGLDVVPEKGRGTLHDAIELCDPRRARSFLSSWDDQDNPEGLVCFPATYLANGKGERIITKIKVNDFRNQPKVTR